MEEDNILPNDGTYFVPTEPEEQAVARKKEKSRTLEALPILKEIVSHLEEHIQELNLVTSMPDDVKGDAIKFMNMHNARELAMTYLVEEKEYIEGLLDTHASNL